MHMSDLKHANHSAPLSAIIIGTGFGGIGMAAALRKQGIENFRILERAQDVGGVWRDNSYPGAAAKDVRLWIFNLKRR